MDKFAVSMDDVNTAIQMGVLAIMIVGAVVALFAFGMGVVH